jgi:hypothetical protein
MTSNDELERPGTALYNAPRAQNSEARSRRGTARVSRSARTAG